MKNLRFVIFGAGFWARFQLGAWTEIEGVECVAIYNRSLNKAKLLAQEFGINAIYDDAEKMLRVEKPDFIDIVTNPSTLSRFVNLAALFKIPVISQKPMAPSIKIGEQLVDTCRKAGISYYIHENWRWQEPTRELKKIIDSGIIGKLFRGRINITSGYNVYKNEPTLKSLEKFILTDMGTHILDVARFLFGEASSLYCQTQKIHDNIKGEDIATVIMHMGENNASVTCEMGYPENFMEHDIFPQTYYFIEGSDGTAEVTGDYWVRVTTRSGTYANRFPPYNYWWAAFDHLIVHESIVNCNKHLKMALQGEIVPETTAEDNLKTLKLVYAAYDSSRDNKVICF